MPTPGPGALKYPNLGPLRVNGTHAQELRLGYATCDERRLTAALNDICDTTAATITNSSLALVSLYPVTDTADDAHLDCLVAAAHHLTTRGLLLDRAAAGLFATVSGADVLVRVASRWAARTRRRHQTGANWALVHDDSTPAAIAAFPATDVAESAGRYRSAEQAQRSQTIFQFLSDVDAAYEAPVARTAYELALRMTSKLSWGQLCDLVNVGERNYPETWARAGAEDVTVAGLRKIRKRMLSRPAETAIVETLLHDGSPATLAELYQIAATLT